MSIGDALIVAPVNEGYRLLEFNGNSSQSTLLHPDTRVLWLYATEDCHFRLGPDGDTATTSDAFIPALTLVYVRAKGGYVHAIRNSSDGDLHISGMTY